jgi:uncharacterized protein YqfA (UPF0365 family)
VLAAVAVVAAFFNLWIQAKATQVPVSLLDMLAMTLRKISPARVVGCKIALAKAGVEVETADMEAHLLCGGNLEAVADALIAAHKAELGVDFRRLAAIDLAGRDVVDGVRTRVNPKVIMCPPAGAKVEGICGVSRDGVRLAVRARVTVRTRLDRLVGGAGEETIVARVGEGIVSAIGHADSHRDILANPELMSAHLLAKGLDSGTAFEILSVDIADVDVLDNVAARLQSVQADTDKRIAQARAESRRAAAVAARQEMRAKTVEMTGRVVTARSRVPLALSSAVREVNLGLPRPPAGLLPARVRWGQLRPRTAAEM